MALHRTDTGTTSEPVLVTMSVLAALQFFFAGATGVSIFTGSELVAGVMAAGSLAVAAAQTGIQFYVRGQVTPNDTVVERVAPDGTVVAGDANDMVTPGTVVRTLEGTAP